MISWVLNNNMTCGIYFIVNTINRKRYIGRAKIIETRYDHLKITNCYYDWTSHHNEPLANAAKKYGNKVFRFIIIEECDESMYIEREQFYLNFYDAANNSMCYNTSSNACGGSYPHKEKTKEHMSELHSGKKNPFYGKKHSEASLKKMRGPRLHTTGENNSMYGKVHSEKARMKMSIARVGLKHSNETKKRMSKTRLKLLESPEERIKYTGVNNSNARITENDVLKIRSYAQQWHSLIRSYRAALIKAIANEYEITEYIAGSVIKFYRWKHIGYPIIQQEFPIEYIEKFLYEKHMISCA